MRLAPDELHAWRPGQRHWCQRCHEAGDSGCDEQHQRRLDVAGAAVRGAVLWGGEHGQRRPVQLGQLLAHRLGHILVEDRALDLAAAQAQPLDPVAQTVEDAIGEAGGDAELAAVVPLGPDQRLAIGEPRHHPAQAPPGLAQGAGGCPRDQLDEQDDEGECCGQELGQALDQGFLDLAALDGHDDEAGMKLRIEQRRQRDREAIERQGAERLVMVAGGALGSTLHLLRSSTAGRAWRGRCRHSAGVAGLCR